MYVKAETEIDSGDKVSVLDVDIDEFASICNTLKERTVYDAAEKKAVAEQAIRSMFDQGYIPLIKRGTTTEPLFEKYKVEEDYMTIILASAQDLMASMGISFDEPKTKTN